MNKTKSTGIRVDHRKQNVAHWNERTEKAWADFRFNQPYAKGLGRLKREVLEKTNFDPTTLWQWGTMQAMAVIEILKRVEKTFQAEGQKLVLDSLRAVGYDIGRQITEGTSIPADMTDAEWISFYATVINTIAYASLESPEIVDGQRANFHIDWCPHQDHYTAFDCRVQRYFVQGMIEAARDFAHAQGRDIHWDVMFQKTIPAGAETCLFHMHRSDGESGERWQKYTRLIEKKALARSDSPPDA